VAQGSSNPKCSTVVTPDAAHLADAVTTNAAWVACAHALRLQSLILVAESCLLGLCSVNALGQAATIENESHGFPCAPCPYEDSDDSKAFARCLCVNPV
jgi:hypothetical protein